MSRRAALGADLVIPVLALAFAAYFFVSIADLEWEAKANGVIIGVLLVMLVAAQLVRVALGIVQARGTLSFAPLWAPREALGKRLGMLLVTVAFIATLPWMGLTLGLLLGMASSLWIMGVRQPGRVAAISAAVAASAYLLFIAALNSAFPRGPIEQLFGMLHH